MMRQPWALGLLAAAFVSYSCKTGSDPNQEDSRLQDTSAIQTMTRTGENFDITCLDGSAQTVSIADFATKDPREICPGIGYSECGAKVLYANGRELKSLNGAYSYPNGSTAITSDGKFRFLNGQLLADASNNLFFSDGSPLFINQSGSLMYPEGNPFKGPNGTMYYPDNSVLAVPGGGLKYPGNQRLLDESGNFFYGDDKSRRLKAGDAFYYRDGSPARSGQTLYKQEDHKQTQTPIIIEEPIGDGAITRGLVRFAIASNQFNYLIDLSKLHPNVIARYESKKNSWYTRYKLPNADFPVQLTFEGKTITKTLYLRTGYTNETAIIDFSKTPISCHIISTATK